ncbi:MAG: RNA polymerase sigma factor [Kiritimatiellae bacterium]|nr:RNA polymerase sigma factor [Kiritimatiellia bacterium]
MEDHLLIRQLRDGDPSAWESLVESMGDRLYRAACLLCRNDRDAEDAVQESYLRLAKTLPRFRGDSSLYTWLYGILLNVVRQQRRQWRQIFLTESPPECMTRGADAGATLDGETASETLLTAMRKLTEEHRAVLTLRYCEQLPIADIAARLRVSPGTVKSRLFYARQQMSVLVPGSLNPFAS